MRRRTERTTSFSMTNGVSAAREKQKRSERRFVRRQRARLAFLRFWRWPPPCSWPPWTSSTLSTPRRPYARPSSRGVLPGSRPVLGAGNRARRARRAVGALFGTEGALRESRRRREKRVGWGVGQRTRAGNRKCRVRRFRRSRARAQLRRHVRECGGRSGYHRACVGTSLVCSSLSLFS